MVPKWYFRGLKLASTCDQVRATTKGLNLFKLNGVALPPKGISVTPFSYVVASLSKAFVDRRLVFRPFEGLHTTSTQV